VGLQCLRCGHLALGLGSPRCWARPARDTWHWGCPTYALGQTHVHGCMPWQDPKLMGLTSGPNSLWFSSGPKAHRSSCMTQFSWVLMQDSLELVLVWARPKKSFWSDCTTEPKKFGDPTTLDLDPILLGPAWGPISIRSCLCTQSS
jgi:hypothetical protein